MNYIKRQKDTTPKDEAHRLDGVQYATGKEQRTTTNNSSRNNDVAGPKWQWRLAVYVSGDESKIQYY